MLNRWAVSTLLATLTFASPSTAQRDLRSGNYWQQVCATGSEICLGYVGGLIEPNSLFVGMGRKPLWCAPIDVTYGQALKVVMLDLDKNPADLHHPFSVLAAAALVRAFPCDEHIKR